MKLGTNSAILGNYSLEEAVDFVSGIGLKSIELACWPVGKAERRYAGVTHVDVDTLNEKRAEEIQAYVKSKNVEIAALAYSPNPLCHEEEMRPFFFSHIKKVIRAARMLNVSVVDTFIGRDHTLSIADNMELFKRYWPEIIRYGEEQKVVVTFENCPMYFTQDEWPGGKNLAVSPKIWREMFKEIDSEYFGITYDPSHFVWQRMDYIKPIYEFRDKIKNVHLKDAKFYADKYDDAGMFANPLEYHSPKLPGLGDIDWGRVMSALTDIKFKGSALIEVEDRSFEDTQDDILDAVKISKNYMSQFFA